MRFGKAMDKMRRSEKSSNAEADVTDAMTVKEMNMSL